MIVGCDRVAANGDVANKVGTYAHALAARAAGIPFVVAGPTSTIDAAHRERRRDRDRGARRRRGPPRAAARCVDAAGHAVRNPAFDVTPAELVTALVTERGVASPPTTRVGRGAARRLRRDEGRALARRRARWSSRSAPDPVAGAGEVVCRVLACGVCGSDVSDGWVAPSCRSCSATSSSARCWRSATGVDGGRDRRPRRRPPPRAVRRVPALPARPRDAVRAVPRDARCDPGGFAEQVRVAGRRSSASCSRRRASTPSAATFVEPLALRAARARPRRAARRATACSSSAPGTSGLLAIAAAHARGVDARLGARAARRAPASARWRSGAERHGNELVDVALVCTTASADGDRRRASPRVAPGGALCLYAPPRPGTRSALDGLALYARELDVVRVAVRPGPRDMRAALELHRERRDRPAARS